MAKRSSYSDGQGWTLNRPLVRALISAAILFHLTAVFAAPLALMFPPMFPDEPPGAVPVATGRFGFGPQTGQPNNAATVPFGTASRQPYSAEVVPAVPAFPSSGDPEEPGFRPSPAGRLAGAINDFFRPYSDAVFINHGYGFFSPDPGNSLLIQYDAEMRDGPPIPGQFPDRKSQWPRLLYHRYFMLSSRATELGRRTLLESYAQHLLKKHGAKRVHLRYFEHRLATPQEVLDGRALDDPRGYLEIDSVEAVSNLEPASQSSSRYFIPGDTVRYYR